MGAMNEGAGIDLSQFYQVFFEEAGENLDNMEQRLLAIDLASADDEMLNAIFRCAHSVKGGAATFGFADVAELTHQMETLLDKLRRHELAATAGMVDVLLAAGDALRASSHATRRAARASRSTPPRCCPTSRPLPTAACPRPKPRHRPPHPQRRHRPATCASSN
jgi:chemotaxis protein histidine kinase CheA